MGCGREFEVGDAIAEVYGINPTVDVGKESVIQNDEEAGAGGPALGGKDSVEEEEARGNDTSAVDEATCEGSQFFFGGCILEEPFVEGFQ